MSLPSILQGDLFELNTHLAGLDAAQRVQWALQNLPAQQVCSSSFGAQSAALLHLLNTAKPGIPVLFVDTGYLFPETYEFANYLTQRLRLKVIRAFPNAAKHWPEADVVDLQHAGVEAISRYNQIHKVEPMQRLLTETQAGTWIAGLRRTQSYSRSELDFLQIKDGRWKLNPLADWTDRTVGQYLQQHDLPYHPLWELGYVSIGDRYLTEALVPGELAEQTRFFGLKRECGLHE
jgi:phosphoadenosine phosphosulfate reductase